MLILVVVAIIYSIICLYRYVKCSHSYKSLIVLLLLSLWNACVLSDVKTWIFVVFVAFSAFVAYTTRKKNNNIFFFLVAILLLFITLFFVDNVKCGCGDDKESVKSSTVSSILPKSEGKDRLQGTRLGDGYKGNYCALQACTIYNGKLYQFFHNGYYEIYDAENMQFISEGCLILPFEIHYGSVQFGEKIHAGCKMPYLYATDHANKEGNVYVIDFEKQKIIVNYNVIGGSIAAYDFSANCCYLIDKDDNTFYVTPFDLASGTKKDLIKLPIKGKAEILQTANFHNGYIYILSGKLDYSMNITKIDVTNWKIAKRKDYSFMGEPEGLSFRTNGEIIVTANVGSWTEGKGTDRYIHSEYVIITDGDLCKK